jgi:hypothetical protein
MLEIKCDNTDGSINWEQRAKIAVLIHKLCKGTKKDLLKSIDIADKFEPNPNFKKLVLKEWNKFGKKKGKK